MELIVSVPVFTFSLYLKRRIMELCLGRQMTTTSVMIDNSESSDHVLIKHKVILQKENSLVKA